MGASIQRWEEVLEVRVNSEDDLNVMRAEDSNSGKAPCDQFQ